MLYVTAVIALVFYLTVGFENPVWLIGRWLLACGIVLEFLMGLFDAN